MTGIEVDIAVIKNDIRVIKDGINEIKASLEDHDGQIQAIKIKQERYNTYFTLLGAAVSGIIMVLAGGISGLFNWFRGG